MGFEMLVESEILKVLSQILEGPSSALDFEEKERIDEIATQCDVRSWKGAAKCSSTSCNSFVSFEALFRDAQALRACLTQSAEQWIRNNNRRTQGTVSVDAYLKEITLYPQPPQPDIPHYLPPEIEELMREAEEVRLLGEKGARSAIGAYRSVLDKMLEVLADEKEIKTTDEKGKEFSRYQLLKTLSEKNILPDNIREWIGSEGIRKLLTEASHGRKFSPQEAQELSEITHFILTYLFTLPKQVEKVRDRFLQNKPS